MSPDVEIAWVSIAGQEFCPLRRLALRHSQRRGRKPPPLRGRGRLSIDGTATHAAISEMKRLSAVLEFIQAEKDKAAPDPEVKPSRTKNGDKTTDRRNSEDGHAKRAKRSKPAKAQNTHRSLTPGLRTLTDLPRDEAGFRRGYMKVRSRMARPKRSFSRQS